MKNEKSGGKTLEQGDFEQKQPLTGRAFLEEAAKKYPHIKIREPAGRGYVLTGTQNKRTK